MPSYILRNIDPYLWARVKIQASTDGIPMRAAILKLLTLYASGEIVIRASTTGTAPYA